MRDALALMRLNHELAIWRRAWHVPTIWWRDDDCREPTWQLDRLLEVRRGLPLTLAVIPDVDLHPLANRLSSEDGIAVAQHGVDHANKLPPGGPRSEFPVDAQQATINAAVRAGRARLVAAGLPPITFVPPWNEASDRLIEAIQAAQYDSYSVGITGRPRDGLKHLGAQVDILRWKGKPHFRGRRRIFDALRKQLEARRQLGAFEKPIGILTHHLVHDEKAWRFLDWFVDYSRNRFDWRSLGELCEPQAPAANQLFPSRIGTTVG
ncbi:MAG: DUF2334 domain-containing protein [Hyphomonadaceae bacterium]